MVLRGRWFNIIDLNVHAPSGQKSGEAKECFYKELEQVKYQIKILLGDINAKLGRENIFKPL
jgi:hypothetical protein